jgi:hypothetical protein
MSCCAMPSYSAVTQHNSGPREDVNGRIAQEASVVNAARLVPLAAGIVADIGGACREEPRVGGRCLPGRHDVVHR